MEAEVAVTLPQAKEHMGLPEAEKARKNLLSYQLVTAAPANEHNWL